MESSQFINQTRLSKKQLQLHVQQQQQNQNKYFLDSPHIPDNNYHIQQQQQRCQYYTSNPPVPHFPGPPITIEYPQNTQCQFEQQNHPQKIVASPTHRLSSIKKFHQSDPNSIEVCIDYENHLNNVGVVSNSKASSIKWNRNNIAATMEKYEPTVKHSNHSNHNHRGHVTIAHHHNRNNSSSNNNSSNNKEHHQFSSATMHGDYLNEIHQLDYAYAYYEPGVPMRHQNIPDYYEEAGPSRAPPPNSIRALLSTARRNNLQRASGKYSIPSNASQRSQENVYEEIRDSEKRRMRAGDSVVSLNQNLVEEEFRRVHNRHQRVLGELNLDVEEMLMPTNVQQPTTVNFIPTTPMLDPSDPMDFLGNGEVNDGSNGAGSNHNIIHNRGSNYNNNNINNNIDLDSGFSGSNSSYIGSLRYQKTNAAALTNSTSKTPTQLSISHQHTDSGSSSFYGGSSGSTTDAIDEIGMTSLCRSSSSIYESGKKSKTSKSPATAIKFNSMALRQDVNAMGNKTERVSFWKVKSRGWMNKLPGFSSTSSINKIGMALFCIWTDESERCPTINSPFH